MLLLFAIATIFTIAWIYLDSGTGDIVDVYGRQFRLAIQMRAWDAFASAGWRLLVLCAVVLLNLGITTAVYASAEFHPQLSIGLCILIVACSLALVPWIYVARFLRFRHWLDCVAQRFRSAAASFATTENLLDRLEPADYETKDGWTAWHPNNDTYPLPETQELWGGVVPVVYLSATKPRTCVIPIDWETFCVWGNAESFAKPGCDLPFCGPGDTRFKVNSLRPLRDARDCWTVHTDMELTGEAHDRV